MRISAILTTLAVLAIAGCSDSSGPPAGQDGVAVNDNRFAPNALSVATGATVTFAWNGSNQHNVTWVAAGGPSPSATQSSGNYQRTFDAAGTYEYYCTIHGAPTSGMRGSVVVQ